MQHLRIPLAKKLPYKQNDWFKQYKNLSKLEPYHILLESGRGGRYSIIGLKPFALLKGKNHELLITDFQTGNQMLRNGDPLELMKEWMSQYKTVQNPNFPDFQGGAIGFVSYDYARYIEKLPTEAKDDLETPDLYFMVFDDVFVFDHHEEVLWLITHYKQDELKSAEDKLDFLEKLWTTLDDQEWQYSYQNPSQGLSYQVSLTESEFKDAVTKIQNYISAGDIFQVNLSVRQSQPLHSHPFYIYEMLRSVNPSPYMSYAQFPEFQLVSGSPELLVKKKGQEVSTRPIAGTRSRGRNEEEDIALANELIENEKERAEHVMLVDLERNDLGRVCEYGTVEVDEFMVIERYSHVMHIVSNVRGILSSGKDEFDVLRATFPGGTITGAPKVRTMEIIEELETVRRGVYTGSIGWISFSGEMEFNIAIRTMVAKDGMAHVQAGAGIVIDSNPKHEYKESLKKAMALWKAKELSEAER
ncbi:anthranilate synthase component I [Litchfieldia alkalitelluris]|uniref:anthranilate synthase component I n=1 Tax=Litchfieldia alkalitelluris TaxID=304268 RepID=UPI001F30E885|nr:anthranilate synthase component I [Litchfieldia alkalitelluris]